MHTRSFSTGCYASDSFQTCLLHFPCTLNISLWPLKSYIRRSYGGPHCVVFNQSLQARNRFCSWPRHQGISASASLATTLLFQLHPPRGGLGAGGGSQLTGHEPVQAVERVWCSGRNSGVNSRALGVSGARPCMNREDLNKLFTNLSFPI